MPIKLPEPPEWWLKYKPLRWVLAALVLYWIFGTLLPRFRAESPPVAQPAAPPAAAPAAAEAGPPPPPPPPAPVAPPPATTATPAAKPEPPPAAPPVPKPAPKPAPPPAVTTTPKPATPAAPADAEPAPDPAAAYTAVAAERVAFMGALRSYDSVAAVQAWLGQGGYASELSTIERKPQGRRYPPYRNDTLVTARYRHGEYEGRLTLEFFNDRLYQAYFVPAQPAEYLRWLRSRGLALPVRRTGRSSLTQGHLRITTNIDFASSDVGRAMLATPFVMWEDLRLVQQMQAWGPVS
jgi:hypothetical protein